MIASILIAAIAIFFYNKTNSKNTGSLIKSIEPTFTKNGQLAFIKKDGNDIIKTINIEIADNDSKRAQGLMWRKSMPENSGMLFIFEDEKPRSFWMKNTYIPLDIIYLNKLKEIVTIKNNTIPLSEISIPSKKPAQFVVEVIAGFCNNYKVNIGDEIKFEITKK